MCDVDKNMLSRAAEMAATRQASKKQPRTYSDYREMLKEKDLDIVLVATPDHWHALAMIAAVEVRRRRVGAKAHQRRHRRRPGDARRRAQVQSRGAGGMQRRSTPHIVEARDNFITTGKLGKIGLVEICCY